VATDIADAISGAWADYDNDGFPDLFVTELNSFNNRLYRNNGNSNAWLTLKLEGRLSNRAAIGAKVRVKATIYGRTFWQLREISGGGGLGSQNDLRAALDWEMRPMWTSFASSGRAASCRSYTTLEHGSS
jgi:hypothetical protein